MLASETHSLTPSVAVKNRFRLAHLNHEFAKKAEYRHQQLGRKKCHERVQQALNEKLEAKDRHSLNQYDLDFNSAIESETERLIALKTQLTKSLGLLAVEVKEVEKKLNPLKENARVLEIEMEAMRKRKLKIFDQQKEMKSKTDAAKLLVEKLRKDLEVEKSLHKMEIETVSAGISQHTGRIFEKTSVNSEKHFF